MSDFNQNKQRYEQNQARQDEHIKLVGKKRLGASAKKAFETVIIGILARIEKSLGELWGHFNKAPTEEQIEMRLVWQELRDDILNHGNDNMRRFLEALDEYSIKYLGNYMNFIVKRKDD